MKRVHFIGVHEAGKTTFLAKLLKEFTRRNIRVGTIKHTPHEFETLDAIGTDTHIHAQSGANPAAVVTPDKVAVFMKAEENSYTTLAPLYAKCDFVLVEGDKQAVGVPKIEVWRRVPHNPQAPLASTMSDITAIITEDDLTPYRDRIKAEIWPANTERIADSILKIVASL